MCISLKEEHYSTILGSLLDEPGLIPAPALVEFRRVVWRRDQPIRAAGEALLQELLAGGMKIEGFRPEDARAAKRADERYGSGNGQGGKLNLLDVMVYAVAKRLELPILCTGKDFAATDADIHPASRRW